MDHHQKALVYFTCRQCHRESNLIPCGGIHNQTQTITSRSASAGLGSNVVACACTIDARQPVTAKLCSKYISASNAGGFISAGSSSLHHRRLVKWAVMARPLSKQALPGVAMLTRHNLRAAASASYAEAAAYMLTGSLHPAAAAGGLAAKDAQKNPRSNTAPSPHPLERHHPGAGAQSCGHSRLCGQRLPPWRQGAAALWYAHRR
jgi:hypothetical protein